MDRPGTPQLSPTLKKLKFENFFIVTQKQESFLKNYFLKTLKHTNFLYFLKKPIFRARLKKRVT